ncbi:MAG: invasin domain 3-containing protein, partial [Trueperaceae bacterium]|nr:invasin domain 3-containing protein [Trueperaceae bacterium]
RPLLALALLVLLVGCSRNATVDAPTAPDRLVVTAVPDAAVAGADLAVAPTVERRDAEGRVVPTRTDVRVRLVAPAANVELVGTAAVSSVDGVATFDALTLSGPAGATPTLRFDSAGVSPVDAGPIPLAAGPAARLHVEGVDAALRRNVPFDVVVVLRDVAGNEAPAPEALTITLRAEAEGDGTLRFAAPRDGTPTALLAAGETRVSLSDVVFTGASEGAAPDVRFVAETDTLAGLEPVPSDPVRSRDLVLAISTTETSLYSDGRDATDVAVTLAGADGTPVSSVDVRLSTTLGTLLTPAGEPIDGTWTATSDARGEVRAALRASDDIDVATVSASCPGDCTVTRNVTFEKEPMVLRFSSTTDFDVNLPVTNDPEATWRRDDGKTRTQTDFVDAITLSAGDWTVEIHGDVEQFGTGGAWDGVDQLDAVERWGDLGLDKTYGAFEGADRAFVVPDRLPPTLTIAMDMFRDTVAFNDDVSTWDVSNVHEFQGMFRDALAFNNGCPPDDHGCPLTWTDVG